MVKKILFVCSGNLDRSPTAEALLKGKEGFEAKSAGILIGARRRLSKNLIDWADIIFAMEEIHKTAILGISPSAKNKVFVLGIPNMYVRNDPELVKVLKERISQYLDVKW
ncbi:MAG: hypothetical protein AYL32_000380 [Candidatus Bathyarchaeota archaeon B26-2]|nr:MAG: hypothetical protein AYL32_000380 [Candidatus Bathyarchaeota archaeon B26-2]